jgi:glutamate dehydrogenase
VQALMADLPSLMSGAELEAFYRRRDGLMDQEVPEELATRVATLDPAYALLGIVEVALRSSAEGEDHDPATVARVHFALGERLGLPTVVQRIFALPRDDRWQTMAWAALRDDLYAVHSQLTAQVLATTSDQDSAAARIHAWEDADEAAVARGARTLAEICADDAADLARLSVALRVVRGLLSG